MNATRLHSTVKSLLEHQITEPVLIFYVFRLTIHISKYTFICISAQGRQTGGGGGWGVTTPPEFWMGGLNTCQPPLILRRFLLEGVGSP